MHIEIPKSRREFLCRSGGGFGALALASLVQQSSAAGDAKTSVPPRAKRVIFLFMEGGPSHIDLFDPKPLINQLAGH
jgi:hypothetical protein